ncbi:MAG: lytic transglycosylase domain-containing protein, partial [Pseudomonadota bacterium]
MQALTRLILIACLTVPPAWAETPEDVRPRPLGWALEAAARGNWAEAERIAARDGAVAADIILWSRLRGGLGTLAEYRAFADRRPDWPDSTVLRQRAEGDVIAAGDAALLEFFAEAPPQTARGILAHAAALEAAGEDGEAQASLVLAWRTREMGELDEAAFLEAHGDLLAPHHAARADMLLWERERADAARLRRFLSAGERAIMDARSALQRRAGNVDAALAAVPEALADDPGLAHDLFEWRVRAGRWDAAKDLIIERSGTLGRADAWANRRRALARDEMRDGDAGRAYRLAAEHGLEEGSAYADLEWLAGYIALTYLEDAEAALAHFQNHRSVIASPISRGRAGYWIGRAHEDLGNADAAQASYADGAQFQT